MLLKICCLRGLIMMDRRDFLKISGIAGLLSACGSFATAVSGGKSKRPNILFCIADDWGYPHATPYGDEVVKTPAFNRLAKEGVLFEHAYVSSPSCTPCRNAILTGQYHWRLKEGANLWSTLDVNIPVYPLLLEKAGYQIGYWRKSWGPGNLKVGGYTDTHPAGKRYKKGFKQFLDARKEGQPFCFWLGAHDPHRGYKKGSGAKSGIPVDKVKVPDFYPDVEEIRSDIADYYFEVQRFDSDCGKAIKMLEDIGELDNTIIVMTGDHGMPFPRCKTNLYDWGVRVPMAMRWGSKVKAGRRVSDFMSFTDLAPTFLKAAGVDVPADMTGRSLLDILLSKKQGRVDAKRDHVIFGRERHTPAQAKPSTEGYPCRGIRTDEYLYIRNFKPQLWPAGVPEGATHRFGSFADCDNSPTKSYLIANKDNPAVKKYYDLSFAKRPGEELYDITKDPDNIKNIAADPKYAKVKARLSAMLIAELTATKDPRVIGGGEKFDQYKYRP
ncbi:MAG: sulfatase [Planctomycetes bacterium]|nr:sulfatase [Planctomycetota bacterium]